MGAEVGTSERISLIRGRTSYTIGAMLSADDGNVYLVGDLIDVGGNAVVHECFERKSGDIYAVKFQVELRDKRRERFLQEVDLLRQLDDPHIIRFVAAGEVDGIRTEKPRTRNMRNNVVAPNSQCTGRPERIPFVVLTKASSSLAEHARNPNQIPIATYLSQFMGLANALVKVNQKALHRDIKPENILVVGDTWAISDFGLCDLAAGGRDLSGLQERIGPVFWMSPEALNKQLGCADLIGQCSDVFQLACVFWYAACGRHPTGIVRQDDWNGPPALYLVLEKALLHNASQRFSSSEEFREALSAAIFPEAADGSFVAD